MNKKVEEMTPLQNSAGVPNQGSATPDVMHTPLFTEEQVRDMVMLQSGHHGCTEINQLGPFFQLLGDLRFWKPKKPECRLNLMRCPP